VKPDVPESRLSFFKICRKGKMTAEMTIEGARTERRRRARGGKRRFKTDRGTFARTSVWVEDGKSTKGGKKGPHPKENSKEMGQRAL